MTTQQLYQSVTDSIVAQLEAGNLQPWKCPWQKTGNGFPLRHNGIAYRGVNVLLLWMTAAIKGYANPYFLTFNQALDYGGSVRKGEKSSTILFCQPFNKEDTAEDGKKGKGTAWMARAYHVFSVEQCDGLGDRFAMKQTAILDPAEKIAHAETYFGNTGATVRHEGHAAYYRPCGDYIGMPAFETFHTADGYYSTLAHECHHWAGISHRLGRFAYVNHSPADYAKEEITAELAATMTMAQLGFDAVSHSDHAAYLGHWIQALREDPKYLFQAASKAQASCDYLNGLQPSFPQDQNVLPIADHE